MLSERSFGGKAFFCNSGAEANEAAIKLARLHSTDGRFKIITFRGGFHGRTYGATSATAQPKYHEGIGPLLGGFAYAPYGDLDAVAKLIDDETCAILVEPIQGEGGINIPPDDFLPGLRKLADEHDLLLMFDEVQSGCGRTGRWFAYEHAGVAPDVMTLAKSLCGGVAGAALLTTADIAPSLRPGMHAATFGGNPIAARAGIATLETIEQENLLDRATKIGERFRDRLQPLIDDSGIVQEIRVRGVMIGIQLSVDGAPIVQQCLDRGLLVNCTQQTVIRLLPAMTLSDEQLDEGCDILVDVIRARGMEIGARS
jgi:acetylornithine/succinyldiaminopimelate/putrescine aminotransferase